jgi:hypothetical protein
MTPRSLSCTVTRVGRRIDEVVSVSHLRRRPRRENPATTLAARVQGTAFLASHLPVTAAAHCATHVFLAFLAEASGPASSAPRTSGRSWHCSADISGFHPNALSSGLPLNVDLDTTLTVLAGNCYRLLARTLPRYQQATRDRLRRHFLDTAGTVNVAADHVHVDLAPRTHTPALIDAGLPDLDLPVPWWSGRRLRFGFPPR